MEVPLVVIVGFDADGDKLAYERIYWDQASVLHQVGLIDGQSVPVIGADAARKVLDPTSVPCNTLIKSKVVMTHKPPLIL